MFSDLTGAATATEDSVRYIRWYSFVNRNFKLNGLMFSDLMHCRLGVIRKKNLG
jgi:hypothetical protein